MGAEVARCADNIVDPEVPTREELLALVVAQRRDWLRLNEFLVATARHYRWCSSFEQRLTLYNECFQVLKLKGREGYQMPAGGMPDPFVFTDQIREAALAAMLDSGQSVSFAVTRGAPSPEEGARWRWDGSAYYVELTVEEGPPSARD